MIPTETSHSRFNRRLFSLLYRTRLLDTSGCSQLIARGAVTKVPHSAPVVYLEYYVTLSIAIRTSSLVRLRL